MAENSDWYAEHQLIHYTKSVDTVKSILQYGFLLIPNKRFLIKRFLGSEYFAEREPQEFGMVSFTELETEEAQYHREQFGDFGIAVTWDWAIRNGAQRVIYIGDGQISETFEWLFKLAKQEIDLRVENPKQQKIILENKAVAGMFRAQIYAKLLTLYEYMEPERNSSQIEWRIVNKLPSYYSHLNKTELVREILSIAKNCKDCSAPITSNDIVMLVCPTDKICELRQSLPSEFYDIPIYTYIKKSSGIARLRTFLKNFQQFCRHRERVVYQYVPPPANTLYVRKNAAGGSVYWLPEVKKIMGIRLCPDEVISKAHCIIQYRIDNGELCDLKVPILDVLYLLNMLRAMERDNGLESLNKSS